MPLQIQPINDPQTWSNFLQNHPYDYFLQTWAWGDFQEQGLGKHVFRLGLYEGKILKGLCLAIEENSRFGKFVYAPRGPVVDWSNENLRKMTLESLTDYFRDKNYLHLRLDPPILLEQTQVSADFKNFKFKPAIRPAMVERAWVLDLEGVTEEDLLAGMSQSNRRHIRKGLKANQTVSFSTDLSDMKQFTQMLAQMSAHKGFNPVRLSYLEKQFKFLSASGIQKLAKVNLEDNTLAMSFISYYGQEASYLHGASVTNKGKLSSSYCLHWESIRHAQQLGLKRYNFWGVLGEKDYHKGHPRYGYSNFKRGFGGHLEEYMRTQDYVYRSLPYNLFKAQEWYRQKKIGEM